MQEQPSTGVVGVAVKMIDPRGVKGARPPDEPVDHVALAQQQLGQVRAVLPGYPSD